MNLGLTKDFLEKNISDLEIIGQLEFNISTCNIENGQYQIDVEIENPKTALIGGSLNFNCKGIKIYDQSKTEIPFNELAKLSKQYWTEFDKKTE